MIKDPTPKEVLDTLKETIIDPLALQLMEKVQWHYLDSISTNTRDLYPIAIIGEGNPLLMLHGFDSCFLEFRRLVPLLKEKNKLIIPDLYGFGFCPRPNRNNYGLEVLLIHLTKVIKSLSIKEPIGVIGASMGGAIALELAKRNPNEINRLLLLSPAGLVGKKINIPWPINQLGVSFLKQPYVRRSLCNQAFANPKESVGKKEEQIASIHLNVPGWHRSLSSFARNGGVSVCTKSLPPQRIEVIWGAQDKIIKRKDRLKTMNKLQKDINEIEDCGHLPHLDKPEFVASEWMKYNSDE